MSVAKIPKTLYDGRVRKIFVFITAVFLSSVVSLFFINNVYAAACQVIVQPSTVERDFHDQITITSSDNCFELSTPYRLVAYPKSIRSLKESYDFIQGNLQEPVTSKEVTSPDGKTLTADLNFLALITGKGVKQPWNLLVCLPIDLKDKNCDKDPVGVGTIIVTDRLPTPTPTPQSDQPIIDHAKQDSCTFKVSYDSNSFITIKVENIDPDKKYVWWTDWDKNKKIAMLNLIVEPIPSLSITPSPSPAPPLYELKIPKSILTPPEKKHPKREEGHLLCIDIDGKGRTGANCLRLFFTSAPPEGNIACSEANSGEVTPIPNPNLSPCSNWVYFNNTSVPTPEPTGTQEEYIRQNNLRNQIKCASVGTGIGNINTDPFEFVKSILSILLSLAGGIAVILIIISGYRLMTSQGNPEAVQGARDQLTSAIVGFLFIIFSLVILQVIGVDILRIPGFGK